MPRNRRRRRQHHRLAWAARNELTEYYIYSAVAKRVRNRHNRKIIQQIAEQEKDHYQIWQNLITEKIRPNWIKIWFYRSLSRILGLSFSLKLMEQGEKLAQIDYTFVQADHPQIAQRMIHDEQKHESQLLNMINEKSLQYISSFVLGLSDALVELTGVLAGLTLALQDTHLITIVSSITGIAASLSMAGSEYLSTKEEAGKNALQAGTITGIAYIITVILLILPYFFIPNPFIALAVTLIVSILIILSFTFYTSVAKDLPFKKRFIEMATISLGVASLNFAIGFFIKKFFGIEA